MSSTHVPIYAFLEDEVDLNGRLKSVNFSMNDDHLPLLEIKRSKAVELESYHGLGIAGFIAVFAVGFILLTLFISKPLSSDFNLSRLPIDFSVNSTLHHLKVISSAPHPFGSPILQSVITYVFSSMQDLAAEAISYGWQASTRKICDDGLTPIAGTVVKYTNVCIFVLSIAPPSVPLNSKGVFLSAHIDSIYNSNAFADDGVPVALSLELARGIIKSPSALHEYNHPLHIAIVDGEEVGLLGSKVAIKHVSNLMGLVINLEACGYNGKMVLFRWTHNHAYDILSAASKADSLIISGFGKDLFSTGAFLVASDFDNYATVAPAVDAAFVEKSMYYHTPMDAFPKDSELHYTMDSLAETAFDIFTFIDTLEHLEFLDFNTPEFGPFHSIFVLPLPFVGAVIATPVTNFIIHLIVVVGSSLLVLKLIEKYSPNPVTFEKFVKLFLKFVPSYLAAPFLASFVPSFLIAKFSPMSFHAFPIMTSYAYAMTTILSLFIVQIVFKKSNPNSNCLMLSLNVCFFVLLYIVFAVLKLGTTSSFIACIISVFLAFIPIIFKSKIGPKFYSTVAITFCLSGLLICAVFGQISFLLVNLLPANFARVYPGFPSEIAFGIGSTLIYFLISAPLMSFVHLFEEKLINHKLVTIVLLVLTSLLLTPALVSLPYSETNPLRATIQYEHLVNRNESRIVLNFPHSAPLELLEKRLALSYNNNNNIVKECIGYTPDPTKSLCIPADYLELPEPVIHFSSKCGYTKCDVSMNITTAESGRLMFVIPSHLKVKAEGFPIENVLNINIFSAEFGSPLNNFSYSFSIEPVQAELKLDVLYTVHRNSPFLDNLYACLMPEITPWGKSYLPGNVLSVSSFVLTL
ncbi:hypothetical protein RCL1_003744 [Eukaryota sp. TZLM3-RCL]